MKVIIAHWNHNLMHRRKFGLKIIYDITFIHWQGFKFLHISQLPLLVPLKCFFNWIWYFESSPGGKYNFICLSFDSGATDHLNWSWLIRFITEIICKYFNGIFQWNYNHLLLSHRHTFLSTSSASVSYCNRLLSGPLLKLIHRMGLQWFSHLV